MNYRLFWREAAKFFSGLVFADFLYWWWLATGNFLPLGFMGVTITAAWVPYGMIVDAVVFLLLVYYGWGRLVRRG